MKATKAEAHYEALSVHLPERCAGCTMFRGQAIRSIGTCTAVEGPIEPNGWCKLWKRYTQAETRRVSHD